MRYLPLGSTHEPCADSCSIRVSPGIIAVCVAEIVTEVAALAATGTCEMRRRPGPPGAVDDLVVRPALRLLVNRDAGARRSLAGGDPWAAT